MCKRINALLTYLLFLIQRWHGNRLGHEGPEKKYINHETALDRVGLITKRIRLQEAAGKLHVVNCVRFLYISRVLGYLSYYFKHPQCTKKYGKIRYKIHTIFPHIVSAETILFSIWKFKGHST